MFLQYSRQIQGPMTQAGQLLNNFERVKTSAKRVFVLFDYPVSVPEASDATVLEDVQGDVTFDDVSFSYPEGEQAITDVSPQADPGETIGLAGPTGSGRATLMKLLLRFYDVSEGGRPGRRPRRPRRHAGESPLDDRLRQPGAVPVHWTVRENIAYGLEVTDDEVRSAAERANAHEFIADLEDGYETAVGKEGDWLSRGQRQRIAIARVILRDPEIIILDEATSHVDNETEVVIQRSLEESIADRTALVSPTSSQRCAPLTASSCLRTARSSNAGPTTSSPPTACMRTSGGSKSARSTPSRCYFSLRSGVGPDLAH
jgi:ATP-binding cassette subfamily B protein